MKAPLLLIFLSVPFPQVQKNKEELIWNWLMSLLTNQDWGTELILSDLCPFSLLNKFLFDVPVDQGCGACGPPDAVV